MNILVIYDYYAPQKLRQAHADHLYSFKRYSKANVSYCNYAFGLSKHLAKQNFDLIIFHQIFAAQFRWSGLSYKDYLKRLEPIKENPAKKVLFCQDEFFKMELIEHFVEEFNISTLFSVAEEDQWTSIYPNIDRSRTKICKVLTGYLDEKLCSDIDNLPKVKKTNDLGYRAFHVPPWLGRGGKLKIDVATKLVEASQKRHYHNDISTICNEKQVLTGLDWFYFIKKCKGLIGVEGGSSLLDYSGTIFLKVKEYLKKHPKAPFEEIESHCFPKQDGKLALFALSPRHLEAALCKTCQLLVEGNYSGVLKPDIHYIPIEKDFSNIDEALDKFEDASLRKQIEDQAYNDLVLSKKYTYKAFIDQVMEECAVEAKKSPLKLGLIWHQVSEKLQWSRMGLEFFLFRKVKRFFPSRLIAYIKQFRNRGKGVYQ